MMKIARLRLSQIPINDLLDLLNHPDVLRHMPLGQATMSLSQCQQWVEDKEAHWAQHAYGPWALMVGDKLAGWGGLQDEAGDADLAVVLHPSFWGYGRQIFLELVHEAFEERGFPCITIHLPLTRRKLQWLERAGFQADGKVSLDGAIFNRFRLFNPVRLTESISEEENLRIAKKLP